MGIRYISYVGVYSKGFAVDSAPYIYMIVRLGPHHVVRVRFLVVCGWRIVRSIRERLRLMAFFLVPGRRHFKRLGCFFTIARAAHSLCTPVR